MKVTIELDRTTPKAQFVLLVNALLAAGNLQGDDVEVTAGPAAAPVINIVKEKPVKEKPVKEKPAPEAGSTTTNTSTDEEGEELSDEAVRAICAEKKAAGKMPKVKALIEKYEGKSATGLKGNAEFMKELKAL